MRILTWLNKLTVRNFIRIGDIIWDRLRGLDFKDVIDPEDLESYPDIAYPVSSGGIYLRRLLNDIKITDQDSIIDIGCGKGRAMMSMLTQPFAKISGIEIKDDYAAAGKKNMERLKAEKCIVYNQNAADFSSYGDYNFFYMFNPFPKEIMDKVIVLIEEAIKDQQKECIIIYLNPCYDESILRSGNFVKIQETKLDLLTTYLYSNWPADKSRINVDRIGSLYRPTRSWPMA